MNENVIAVIGIIMKNYELTDQINTAVHAYREFIIGRMGLPHARKDVGVISLILDAPKDKIESLCSEIGKLPGIKTQTIFSDPS